MKYVGVDLHKKTISVCVVTQEAGKREVIDRGRLLCSDPDSIEAFFGRHQPFQFVVEASSSYEWFVQLVEPMAERAVLAHPKKLRVIAESTRKTDKLDAQVLAEFLALDMIPQAHRPSPRVRDHRRLVRFRCTITRRIASIKCRLRWIVASYNADIPGLFSPKGLKYLRSLELSPADRYCADDHVRELEFQKERLASVTRELREFAKSAPIAEREAREILETIPYVGPITIDVILSEIGDIRRFRSQKKVVSYAGLCPGIRESAGKSKQMRITKEGSRLVRWALVEAAWRLVARTSRWEAVYEKLKQRCGAKKAIVAVARKLLCVMASMLRSATPYRYTTEPIS